MATRDLPERIKALVLHPSKTDAEAIAKEVWGLERLLALYEGRQDEFPDMDKPECDEHHFSRFDAALAAVAFYHQEHHDLSDDEIHGAVAKVMWGLLGGFDGDDLQRVTLSNEGDSINMVVAYKSVKGVEA